MAALDKPTPETVVSRCRWFHRWGKWIDWQSGKRFYGSESQYGWPVLIQERRCGRCNAAQRRTVES